MSNQYDGYYGNAFYRFMLSHRLTSFVFTNGKRTELSFAIFSISAGVVRRCIVDLSEGTNRGKQAKNIKRLVHAAADIAQESPNEQLLIYCHQSSRENVEEAMTPFVKIFQGFPKNYVLKPFEELINEMGFFCSHVAACPPISTALHVEDGSWIDNSCLAVDFVQKFLVRVVYPAEFGMASKMLDAVIEFISLTGHNVPIFIPSQLPQIVARKDKESVANFFARHKPEITLTEDDGGKESLIDLEEM
ncbi:Stackhouse genomic scaffold, scaffold 140 [Trichuris trichiura]|uniref:Stackhouse genomic scaffold, scaffold 140 n=1 Tax=Trichuris trichiura TaxID=36087 RepID=A0A077ZCA3_TRITR|nr:Stackhouse genomic scaffold, scaffold 140 [Trichuris trichiura]